MEKTEKTQKTEKTYKIEKTQKLGNITTNRYFFKTVILLIACLGTEIHILFTSDIGVPVVMTAVLLFIQLVAAGSDLRNRTIPIWLILSSMVFGALLLCFSSDYISVKAHIIGGLLAFLIIAPLIYMTKGQIGTGDLMLLAVTGLFSGWTSLLNILFISVFLSGVFSLFIIVLKKVSGRSEIPFAPFIFLATVIVNL